MYNSLIYLHFKIVQLFTKTTWHVINGCFIRIDLLVIGVLSTTI